MHRLSINFRFLICCICHFQSGSPFFAYLAFLCLQVFSVSNFFPDTREQTWPLTYAHLFSCVVGREGHYRQILVACVGSAHSGWTTLGLPQPKAAWTSQVHTAQAPACSARALSQVDSVSHALTSSKLFRFSGALQRHRPRWAVHFVLFPGQAAQATGCLLSIPSQVVCVSYTLAGPGCSVPRCTTRAQSQVCCVSPLGRWSHTVTLLADVNRLVSQEDVVSNWQPTQSLVEDAVSGAKIAAASCFPALAVTRLPFCLQGGRTLPLWQPACSRWVFAHSFVLWVCQGSLCSMTTFLSNVFFFCLCGDPTVWVAISH